MPDDPALLRSLMTDTPVPRRRRAGRGDGAGRRAVPRPERGRLAHPVFGGGIRNAASLRARPLPRDPEPGGVRHRARRRGGATARAGGGEPEGHEHAAAGGQGRGVAGGTLRESSPRICTPCSSRSSRTGSSSPRSTRCVDPRSRGSSRRESWRRSRRRERGSREAAASSTPDAPVRDRGAAHGEDPGGGRVAVNGSREVFASSTPDAPVRDRGAAHGEDPGGGRVAVNGNRKAAAPPAPIEIGYRLDRRVRGIRPGMHPGTEAGGGLEPLSHVPLLDGRDPRRLDLPASIRDPLRRWLVRRYRQRASVRVYVIADLSASLGFRAGATGSKRWPPSPRRWGTPPAAPAMHSHSSAATSACARGSSCLRRGHPARFSTSPPACAHSLRAGAGRRVCWRRCR